jgi:hypothetical protein
MALALGLLSGFLVMGSEKLAVAFAMLLWLPTWLVSLLLRVSSRLGWCVEFICLLGMLAVLVISFLYPDNSAWWSQILQEMFASMLQHAPEGMDAEQMQSNIQFLSHYMNGLVAAASALGLILGLLLARWWQAELFNPGGFRKEFLALRLHGGLAYLGLACLAVAIFAGESGGETARNLGAVFFLLFMLVGISVMHFLLAAEGPRRFVLTGAYIILFFIPQALLPVALLGLSDTWFDWRRLGMR